MTEGLDRLRRVMAEAGIEERTDEDGTVPEQHHTVRPTGRLWEEIPPSYMRCAICCSAPIHSQRKVRVATHPDQWAHPLCASLPQQGAEVLRYWLATPFEIRRRRVVQHFGIDPLGRRPTAIEIEWLSLHADIDGLPAVLDVDRHRQRKVPTMGVPRCWWSFAPERGWLS